MYETGTARSSKVGHSRYSGRCVMDDDDAVFCANMLLADRLTLEMKRGHLQAYFEKSGITAESTPAERAGALEKLIYCLGTKTQHATVARAIDELLTQRYTQ